MSALPLFAACAVTGEFFDLSTVEGATVKVGTVTGIGLGGVLTTGVKSTASPLVLGRNLLTDSDSALSLMGVAGCTTAVVFLVAVITAVLAYAGKLKAINVSVNAESLSTYVCASLLTVWVDGLTDKYNFIRLANHLPRV